MKTMRFTSRWIYALILLGFVTTSCDKECFHAEGEGPVQRKEYPINDFAGVDSRIGAKINIIYDSEYSVSVTTYENYQHLLHMYVNNGILIIESHKSLDDDEISIDIHTPRLNSIELGGSGKIHTVGSFTSSTLNIQLGGSGEIDFTGDVNTLRSNISGSGKISLLGTSSNAVMNISGSGEIDGYSMECANNDATLSGSGTIRTFVTGFFKVKITGSGSIYYLGNPAMSTHISGSGDIIQVH